MITSAEEFKRLRESEIMEEYNRAAWEEASIEVWRDVLKKYPELAFWVAHNKTIQLEILRELAKHPDSKVRDMIAMKRKITDDIVDLLKDDKEESVRCTLMDNRKITLEQKMRIRTDDSEHLQNKLREIIEQKNT